MKNHVLMHCFLCGQHPQGNFERNNILQELRYELLENATKEYVEKLQRFIRGIHTTHLSCKDILWCDQNQFDGIHIMNAARADQAYMMRCGRPSIGYRISEENYNKALEVPLDIRNKFLRGIVNDQEYNFEDIFVYFLCSLCAEYSEKQSLFVQRQHDCKRKLPFDMEGLELFKLLELSVTEENE
jgi:inhibitor of KinA sporulation pathway (predicted exonuclease)